MFWVEFHRCNVHWVDLPWTQFFGQNSLDIFTVHHLKGLEILSTQQHDGVDWDPSLKEGAKLTQDSVVAISIRKGSQPGYADLTIGTSGREYKGSSSEFHIY